MKFVKFLEKVLRKSINIKQYLFSLFMDRKYFIIDFKNKNYKQLMKRKKE